MQSARFANQQDTFYIFRQGFHRGWTCQDLADEQFTLCAASLGIREGAHRHQGEGQTPRGEPRVHGLANSFL